jgi:hypothetical protein
MNIYSYAVFAYGLTAIISFFTIGLILLLNKMLKHG